jgi:hypothetical protein
MVLATEHVADEFYKKNQHSVLNENLNKNIWAILNL